MCFFLQLNTKDILKNVSNHIIFILRTSMANGNCLVINLLQNIFWVQQNKETHTGLGQTFGWTIPVIFWSHFLGSIKVKLSGQQWQNFHFYMWPWTGPSLADAGPGARYGVGPPSVRLQWRYGGGGSIPCVAGRGARCDRTSCTAQRTALTLDHKTSHK